MNTIHGKLASALAVLSVLLPTASLLMLGRIAEAQVVSLPNWAVVDFEVKKGLGDASLGRVAADALIDELSKTQRYVVLSSNEVEPVVKSLGYPTPVTRKNDLIRLGQALRVDSIVSGEIVNSRISNVGGGKRADVMVRGIVWDIASGEQVNGAAVLQSSGVRAGDVSDETLLSEALSTAAFNITEAIQKNTLPVGTILNTTDRKALLNQGSRSGFVQGQEVIILRGREQVARGRIASVEPDQAFVTVSQQFKGIQPGDRVRAVFAVPMLDDKFPRGNEPRTISARSGGGNSGLVTTLLVLGGVLFLVGGSGGNSSNSVSSVVAEPTVVAGAPEDLPAVKISWRTDAFIKGNQDRVQFQVWRDDVIDAPVMVVPGTQGSAIDRGSASDSFNWGDYPIAGGFDCDTSVPGTLANGRALRAGLPYTYSVELIYRVNSIDVPGSTSGSTGGTTGGATGGTTAGTGRPGRSLDEHYGKVARQLTAGGTGGTTAGTTGGTSGATSGVTAGGTISYCYFRTSRAVAKGSATPFVRPRLSSPENNQTVAAPTVFRFTSVRGARVDTTIEYCIQFSDDALFPAGRIVTALRWQDRTGTGTLSTPQPISAATTVFPTASRVYWRVGARNIADKPGPVSVNGERYIFSEPFWYNRPVVPPGP